MKTNCAIQTGDFGILLAHKHLQLCQFINELSVDGEEGYLPTESVRQLANHELCTDL